jgi:integrase/recombinase XerD
MREQPAIRRPVSVPRPVPLDVVRAAIDASDGHVRIWISLMAYAGLRGMEVAATGPAHLDGQRLYLPRCKGGGDGMAHLPLWLADELRQTRAWHVDTAHVRRCVRQALRQAGSNATPHALRHTYGTAMLRATGGDLRETQTAMRHKSVSSTQIYTLVDGLRISQAADRLPR